MSNILVRVSGCKRGLSCHVCRAKVLCQIRHGSITLICVILVRHCNTLLVVRARWHKRFMSLFSSRSVEFAELIIAVLITTQGVGTIILEKCWFIVGWSIAWFRELLWISLIRVSRGNSCRTWSVFVIGGTKIQSHLLETLLKAGSVDPTIFPHGNISYRSICHTAWKAVNIAFTEKDILIGFLKLKHNLVHAVDGLLECLEVGNNCHKVWI